MTAQWPKRRVTTPDQEPMLLADTGATHEFQPILKGTRPPVPADKVPLTVATGKDEAWMGVNGIVYYETPDPSAIQPLFPIGFFIEECGLTMVMERGNCEIRMPADINVPHIYLHKREGGMFIRETDAKTLRGLVVQCRARCLVACANRMVASVAAQMQAVAATA